MEIPTEILCGIVYLPKGSEQESRPPKFLHEGWLIFSPMTFTDLEPIGNKV